MVNVDGEKPVVDEDVEVKRMKRLEQLRARRPFHAISEDGSGWIPLSSKSADPSNSDDDMSPLRKQRVRNDTPSPEPELNPSISNRMRADLSPSHQNQSVDISPPRRRPHRQLLGNDARKNYENSDLEDLSPPRRGRHDSPSQDTLHGSVISDLSPPRKRQNNVSRSGLSDVSHGRSSTPSVKVVSHPSLDPDLSPPRKNRKELSIPSSVNERKTGLISGKDIRDEIDKKKKDDMLR